MRSVKTDRARGRPRNRPASTGLGAEPTGRRSPARSHRHDRRGDRRGACEASVKDVRSQTSIFCGYFSDDYWSLWATTSTRLRSPTRPRTTCSRSTWRASPSRRPSPIEPASFRCLRGVDWHACARNRLERRSLRERRLKLPPARVARSPFGRGAIVPAIKPPGELVRRSVRRSERRIGPAIGRPATHAASVSTGFRGSENRLGYMSIRRYRGIQRKRSCGLREICGSPHRGGCTWARCSCPGAIPGTSAAGAQSRVVAEDDEEESS